LRAIEKKTSLSVIDNGIGFDVAKTTTEQHYGLLNMQKRVSEIEAQLAIKSKIGVGTEIEVIL
jgi:signal transduction histidine kinase